MAVYVRKSRSVRCRGQGQRRSPMDGGGWRYGSGPESANCLPSASAAGRVWAATTYRGRADLAHRRVSSDLTTSAPQSPSGIAQRVPCIDSVAARRLGNRRNGAVRLCSSSVSPWNKYFPPGSRRDWRVSSAVEEMWTSLGCWGRDFAGRLLCLLPHKFADADCWTVPMSVGAGDWCELVYMQKWGPSFSYPLQ